MIGDFPHAPDWAAPELDEVDGVLLHRKAGFGEVVHHVRGGLVYLATPYSLKAVNAAGRWDFGQSFAIQEQAIAWAWRFAAEKVSAMSPVVMAADIVHHDYARNSPPLIDPLDAAFWEHWCLPLLTRANAVVIPPIDGWAESLGVWREAIAAFGAMKPVWLIGEEAS